MARRQTQWQDGKESGCPEGVDLRGWGYGVIVSPPGGGQTGCGPHGVESRGCEMAVSGPGTGLPTYPAL